MDDELDPKSDEAYRRAAEMGRHILKAFKPHPIRDWFRLLRFRVGRFFFPWYYQ